MEKQISCLPEGYKVPEIWEAPTNPEGTMGAMNQPTAGARSVEELPRGKHDLQLYSLGTPNGVKVRNKRTIMPYNINDKTK